MRRRTSPIRLVPDFGTKPRPVIITRSRFALIREALGGDSLDLAIQQWEAVEPPSSAKEFAWSVIFVITNSRIGVVAANPIYHRCLRALKRGKSASAVYRHSGKARAMDYVWQDKTRLFKQWRRLKDAQQRVTFCGKLPWIGRLSRYALAKQLGANVVIPEVRLRYLAALEGLSAWELCHRLAQQTGYREASVETVLTTAFMEGLIDPTEVHIYGWDEGTPRLDHARKCFRIIGRAVG